MVFQPDKFTINFGKLEKPDEARKIIVSTKEEKPVSLFLPSTYEDAIAPPMRNIISVLEGITYLDEIVIGLDKADTEEKFKEVKSLTDHLPNRVLIWNDSPEMQRLYQEISDDDLKISPGKGRNLWTGLGDRFERKNYNSMILHDCDIQPGFYSENILLSLLFPLVHPKIGVHFVKAYYERVTDPDLSPRFAGRVTRVLMNSLIDSMDEVYGRIPRVRDFLNYMRSFKYILSGEFGMGASLADILPIQSDYGLETGMLGFLHNRPYKIGQVDLGRYDHRHQELSAADPQKGLHRMAIEITKTIFRKLYSIAGNEVLDDAKFEKLMTVYFTNNGTELINNYFKISKYRGMSYNALDERAMLVTFERAVIAGFEGFKKSPKGTRLLPSWHDIDPSQRKELTDIIRAYNPGMK
ncbi:hypothetical protein JXB28_06450 [Candidatus Woesearchaeota archaeon]|nr:hypothetical protein [Candidatus Woesearchaeota archaeon]